MIVKTPMDIFNVLYIFQYFKINPKQNENTNPPMIFIVPKNPESSVLNPCFSTILSMTVLKTKMLVKYQENQTQSLMNSLFSIKSL